MGDKEKVQIQVAELDDRTEYGKGFARIDRESMDAMTVKEGEIVEIEGERKTAVIARRSYPRDSGIKLIRIDGLSRKNAGIGIGEFVKVRKAFAKEAKKIILAPAEKGMKLLGDMQQAGELIKQDLLLRPFINGDILSPKSIVNRNQRDEIGNIMGGDDMFADFLKRSFRDMGIPSPFENQSSSPIALGNAKLAVVSTSPEGIVQVTENTRIELNPEAMDIGGLITYDDIGGLRDSIEKIREMVELPLRHPELFRRVGIDPPRGVLLYGPPGTGKTLLAKAVANESGASFFSIAGPEVMSKWYGGSEENLRKVFEEAEKNAPSIIFIDEIDSIAPKREQVTGEVERRVVSQLLSLMDGLKSRGKVIVIAATNRPNAIDEALRRGGRFDREIEIGVPDTIGRKEVLQIHTRNMPLAKDVNICELANKTYGFVGADLEGLAKEAAMSALRRNLPNMSWKESDQLPQEVLENLKVTKKDFENALKMVEPSAMREVMIEIPNVKWEDVGGLENVKEKLKEMVEWPLQNPKSFERLGIRPPTGILLYGPPGCGKTMIAKAVATEAGANFISVKGPEVLTMWVGESERKLREIFRRAKQVAPSIIFFDEIDSLAPRRGMSLGTKVTENIVSQILTEMSGLEDMHNVTVMAATNRPDMLDPAILRPGRFDRQVIVKAPNEKARLEILKVHTKNMPLAKDVDMKKMAKETEGFSGADLESLIREAGLNAMREKMDAKEVKKKHFRHALDEISPSINPEMIKFYEKLMETMKAKPVKEAKKKAEEMNYVG